MQWRFPEEQREKVLVSVPDPVKTLVAVPVPLDQTLMLAAEHVRDPRLARAAQRLVGQPKDVVVDALRSLRGKVDPYQLKAVLESVEAT